MSFVISETVNFCVVFVRNKENVIVEDKFFKLEYNKVPPKKGSILVSEPYSGDMFFQRSVVLLVEHNKSGTVGFILNKPFSKTISKVTDYFGSFDAKVNIGGPVGNQNLYYLHTMGEKIAGSVPVQQDLFWGGNFSDIKLLAKDGLLDESDIKFFLGYSGWDAGQLASEIKKDYWLVSSCKTSEIMADANDIWRSVLGRMDSRYKVWSNFPVNPDSN